MEMGHFRISDKGEFPEIHHFLNFLKSGLEIHHFLKSGHAPSRLTSKQTWKFTLFLKSSVPHFHQNRRGK